MDARDGWTAVSGVQELRDLMGPPMPRAAAKDRSRLLDLDRAFLAASPFCLIATSDADGNCDVSPKGDPPGFTLVLDDTTIAIPDRPGNRRADGLRNILANPHVGLIHLVPGRADTLRINGRARLLRGAPFFDRMVVDGHRPSVVILVEVEQVFLHCPKAFMRSALWDPDRWDPGVLPSTARMLTMCRTSPRAWKSWRRTTGRPTPGGSTGTLGRKKRKQTAESAGRPQLLSGPADPGCQTYPSGFLARRNWR